ncbi:MAG: hypothetical protein ACJ76Z_07485 [Thermoleophilaceae bacterium]
MKRPALVLVVASCACAVPLAADAAKPPANTSLTISAKPAAVTYGGSVVIAGTRRGPNHANRPVALQANPYPFRGYKDVAVVRTSSKGAYRFTVKPRRHTRYRTVSPSPATIYDTVIKSPEALVHVRLRVGIRLSDSTPRRGQRVRFFGSVTPKHNGRKVFIQRRRRDGRWRTVARTLTRNASGNRSTYSRRVRIRRTGAYRVRVRGDADHSTGTSRRRLIRVH